MNPAPCKILSRPADPAGFQPRKRRANPVIRVVIGSAKHDPSGSADPEFVVDVEPHVHGQVDVYRDAEAGGCAGVSVTDGLARGSEKEGVCEDSAGRPGAPGTPGVPSAPGTLWGNSPPFARIFSSGRNAQGLSVAFFLGPGARANGRSEEADQPSEHNFAAMAACGGDSRAFADGPQALVLYEKGRSQGPTIREPTIREPTIREPTTEHDTPQLFLGNALTWDSSSVLGSPAVAGRAGLARDLEHVPISTIIALAASPECSPPEHAGSDASLGGEGPRKGAGSSKEACSAKDTRSVPESHVRNDYSSWPECLQQSAAAARAPQGTNPRNQSVSAATQESLLETPSVRRRNPKRSKSSATPTGAGGVQINAGISAHHNGPGVQGPTSTQAQGTLAGANSMSADEHRAHCDVCKCPISPRISLAEHMITHENINSHEAPTFFDCLYCKTRVFSQDNLDRHMKKHRLSRRYECIYCSETRTTRRSMDDHVAQAHTREKTHKCKVCSELFFSSRARWRHEKLHKEAGEEHFLEQTLPEARAEQPQKAKKSYQCEKCEQTFESSREKWRHQKQHLETTADAGQRQAASDDKAVSATLVGKSTESFACPFCVLVFSEKWIFLQHLKSHGLQYYRSTRSSRSAPDESTTENPSV